jgi:NTP pyrophosphatase (non-canonical NTP hydrolase)
MKEDTFQRLTEVLIDFREARDWGRHHTPENLAKSICIEAAELLECYQWGDEDLDPYNIEEEVADVTIYLLLFCHEAGVDLERAIINKVKYNGEKYPLDIP